MEIKTPDLGVESAEVSEIMVKVGDVIAIDDNIVLLESDKASVEVPATVAGKITHIAINIGDKVKEGDVLVQVETSEIISEPQQVTTVAQQANIVETPAVIEQPAVSQPAQTTAENTYNFPDLGVEQAQVSELMIAEGDTVEKDQPIVLVESDKASVEVPAPVSGKVVKLLIQTGDTITNGQAFITIASINSLPASQPTLDKVAPATPEKVETTFVSPASPVTKAPETNDKLNENQVNALLANVYAGPAVRKITRQLGVNIAEVKGTGVNGRILKEDVFGYVKQRLQNPVTQTASPSTVVERSGLPALPDMSKTDIWGELETQDLSRLQKVSIPQLNYNTYLPQVTQFDLSDITDTEKLRSELKDELKKQGISLTILAFIMKATAYALMEFPKFNSHLTDDNTQIIIRKTVHMGFAVATNDGLTVPVIRDVQNKGIKQIAKEIGELALKARDKKLGAKELTGASFTISSQGNLGGTAFTPLVNWPQVGILGVSEASMQPRWNASTQSFEPRLMLPLSLSYDHRVINGADAAVFTRYIAKLLADPRRILL